MNTIEGLEDAIGELHVDLQMIHPDATRGALAACQAASDALEALDAANECKRTEARRAFVLAAQALVTKVREIPLFEEEDKDSIVMVREEAAEILADAKEVR